MSCTSCLSVNKEDIPELYWSILLLIAFRRFSIDSAIIIVVIADYIGSCFHGTKRRRRLLFELLENLKKCECGALATNGGLLLTLQHVAHIELCRREKIRVLPDEPTISQELT